MKIQTKITLASVGPLLVALAAVLVTFLIQQRQLTRQVDVTIRDQGFSEASKLAQSVYWLCASTEERNQSRLTHDLAVARQLMQQKGRLEFAPDTVHWDAVNQLTKERLAANLPKVMLGSNWLGQVTSTNESAGLVDEAKLFTRDFCTVFQRMNDAGDMLRVSTSVVKDDGSRAIGTYIPAVRPDGSKNPIIETVLRGDTYRGRAFVVNQWHCAGYEPLWDAAHQRVIGMLYVGIGLREMNKELLTGLVQMKVGKTGYVFILGGDGDERGKYILSRGQERDGENIWESKDASGRLFVQSIIQKGMKAKNGAVDFEVYSWKNPGESAARPKFAAVTSFGPWNWVIGACAYEDDYAQMRTHIEKVQRTILIGILTVAIAIALLAAFSGAAIARTIARPINHVIRSLSESARQISDAASQVSGASQTLAEGSSEQAASTEETSASLEEMSSMTRRNSENVQKANELARETRQAAEKGVSDMTAMNTAMDALKNSSGDIAKIIKTIDEIAFQTNILALNAAVEAARAGEAGMGFAVVADEVRSLAQRSAQAAKETAAKIESAITNTAQGVSLSAKVASALSDIATRARQVDELAVEVAHASREQNQGIQQVNGAVAEMEKSIQSNAASAEESAAAAQELSAQAQIMKQLVGSLVSLVGDSDPAPAAAPGTPAGPHTGRRDTFTAPAPTRIAGHPVHNVS
ncbi:MAG: methyl-accepting chemotaxis protein [Verrucomicrobiota bacterium]